MNSRLKMTVKNAFWSYFSMAISLVMQFASRTVFIYCLGKEFLGINGLFTNLLGVLSFAELGIGTAINFSLYKPVSDGDIEKIKAYMYYYKWAYRIIAIFIAVLGLILLPFLDLFITDPGNVGDVRVYYIIYLFNTVTSYFVSYKYSLANAEQKSYIYTNINTICNFVILTAQMIALLIWKNFLVYLLIAAIFGLIQKVFTSIYFNKLYPYLRDKTVTKLSKSDKHILITKIKAMVIHKIGDVSVHQTDNIIVSSFISTVLVGVISNYTMIIGAIQNCVNILFNSVIGSLGNLVATESKEKQYQIFKDYRFIGFWIFGFCAVALATLINPFITLWLGKDLLLEPAIINIILIDFYMIGQRICINNFKSSAGVVEQDRYVAFLQAVVNLVVSIILAKKIGLIGVYIGTLVQGLLASILKPVLSYKVLFNISSWYYFKDSAKYAVAVLISYFTCQLCSNFILSSVNILNFIIMILLTVIIPNLIFTLLFFRTEEFKYFYSKIASVFKKIKNR